jgi:hypothetical protein
MKKRQEALFAVGLINEYIVTSSMLQNLIDDKSSEEAIKESKRLALAKLLKSRQKTSISKGQEGDNPTKQLMRAFADPRSKARRTIRINCRFIFSSSGVTDSSVTLAG